VDPFHVSLVAASAAVVTASLLVSAAGLDVVWSLLVVALTPCVTVVGHELRGHRHDAAVVADL